MSAEQFITEHLDLWTGAVTTKSTGGRGSQNGIELTGIKKLRELIADLAVRGKLLQQEPTDESASNLAIKIAAEREQLVKTGAIKRLKRLPQIDVADQPYCLPPNWAWIRLGEATNYGITEKAEPNDVSGETWVLELEDIEKESSRLVKKIRQDQRPFKSSKNRFQKNDVLYGKLRPYLDKVVVADECGVCTTEIVPLRGFYGLAPDYLQLALKSPAFKNYANSSTHGMNLPRLGTDKARLALLPLPPENEQHRIVQKVDELMALCDRLEQQTRDQHAAHETLVDSLLETLTQSNDADELSENWARLAAHFDMLFTTEQSIERLKQTILQLGIMGRIAKQSANDEPASVLFKNINTNNIKNKSLPDITSNEKQFKIPNNWLWVKFGHINTLINGDRSKNYPNRDEYVREGLPWINTGHIQKDGTLSKSNMNFITEEKFNHLKSGKIRTNDLVYCLRGATLGKTASVSPYSTGAIASSLMIVRPHIPAMQRYIFYYLISPFGRDQIARFNNGSAQPNLSANSVALYAFPLPPLREQKRIVKRIDELFSFCDQLKARLLQVSKTRWRTADAVVEQAIH